MACVTVDVDIDEFDLDEILDGVECKWDAYSPEKKADNRKEIKQFFSDLIDESVETPTKSRSTVIDELKMSVVMSGLENKSLTELQEFFK